MSPSGARGTLAPSIGACVPQPPNVRACPIGHVGPRPRLRNQGARTPCARAAGAAPDPGRVPVIHDPALPGSSPAGSQSADCWGGSGSNSSHGNHTLSVASMVRRRPELACSIGASVPRAPDGRGRHVGGAPRPCMFPGHRRGRPFLGRPGTCDGSDGCRSAPLPSVAICPLLRLSLGVARPGHLVGWAAVLPVLTGTSAHPPCPAGRSRAASSRTARSARVAVCADGRAWFAGRGGPAAGAPRLVGLGWCLSAARRTD